MSKTLKYLLIIFLLGVPFANTCEKKNPEVEVSIMFVRRVLKLLDEALKTFLESYIPRRL
jgi:hypothetical protein